MLISVKDQALEEKVLNIEEKFRLSKLEEKRQRQSFEVAFCGHFSAGKSTILNTLIGAQVLPTSPIPTSANIIRIKNGELGLSLRLKGSVVKEWKDEIPWDQVRSWGMNGNDISHMTITAPLPFLSEYSCILDTPGVDSTDESHEAVTVEQLYTTDANVYVMDYNHVQSETNLYFLQQLTKEKKPIFIVINQIDKHNEKEIPISIFKRSVMDIFHKWEISFINLYFTSMKNPDHPLNEFSKFEKDIKSLVYNSKSLLEGAYSLLKQGFYRSIEYRLLEEKQESIDGVKEEMNQKGFSVSKLDEKHNLNHRWEELTKYEERLRDQMDKELGSLFKTVTLFPFTTTDLAREWIHSIQPGFKTGLLFSKKKTKEEQERRLQLLAADLQEKVKSQLLFHVQDFFQKVDRSQLTNAEQFEEAYDQLTYEVKEEMLKVLVKTGHSNRDYVFQYTKEVTNDITKVIRAQAIKLLELQISGSKDHIDQELRKVSLELDQLKEIDMFIEKMDSLEVYYDSKLEMTREKIEELPTGDAYLHQLKETTYLSYPENKGESFLHVTLPKESVIETDWDFSNKNTASVFDETETTIWLENIWSVLKRNSNNQILEKERKQLIDRIVRYKNQRFIVSLFGAFSAGKSSFANALLGNEVLAVSPNPTTATVNIIEKATETYPHGTAVISVKSEEALNMEICSVSQQFDENLDIYRLSEWIPTNEKIITSMQKTYGEYLLTLKESLGANDLQLGTSFSVPIREVQAYAAEESKACLVEKITIYYDCPLTEKGIVLVDTPGVNSIHGRHTNVAFQQMRQSDAIFYLTYFNHAFSKADQYFLQQMGKVNESFEHDKLYFVINAADLAANMGELNGVRKHVHDQLVQNGIEEPRLYHLSSREGLRNKQEGDVKETSFTQFESSFHNHTILELKELSMKMISHQLGQYVNLVRDSLQVMDEEKEEKQKRYNLLKEVVMKEQQIIKESTFSNASRDILQELDQLVHYLKDRMRYVLNDYYTTAINVAVLNGSSKKELHRQLSGAILDWKHLGEQFLKQELEGTLIRIEEKIKLRSKEWVDREIQRMKKNLPHIHNESTVTFEGLQVENEPDILIQPIEYLVYLRNKREFFEHGKWKELKEKLVFDGTVSAGSAIERTANKLKYQLEHKLEEIETQAKNHLLEAISTELERFEVLIRGGEKESLSKELEQLKKFTI